MRDFLLIAGGAVVAFVWMIIRFVWVFGGKDFLLGERHKKDGKKKKSDSL